MKSSVINRGFSLIEVVVALFIFSISVITIYNLILSTAASSFDLEQRYLAKEVANNRISLINTIEKSSRPIERSGEMIMGVKNGNGMRQLILVQMTNFLNIQFL